ncbi:MAG: hypothetical protein AMXMBFR82_42790 [Candidatus Hydrogenedentota bacterium]
MPAIKCVSRRSDGRRSIPASAVLPESPQNRYKSCLNEQTTLSGKKGCLNEYLDELAEDKNP